MEDARQFPVLEHEHSHHDGKPGAPGDRGRGGAGGAGGAGGGAVMNITNQSVEAGCGVCVFGMPGVTGCPLAVKIDGKTYLVEGAEWPNHDYCERECKALVSGRIEGGTFIATSLKPTG